MEHDLPLLALEAVCDVDGEVSGYRPVEAPACGETLTPRAKTFTCDDVQGHESLMHRHVLDRNTARAFFWCGQECAQPPCSGVLVQLGGWQL